ncbi:DUF5343 domain-containing protein [Caulobacter segnis]|uniref:DUF5343 domain-containing protein n=1 Tax=Caulobacter segnis TaxID=88688 RepID=UPI0024102FCB|nr:DUF5343 domain-containing protein [Caulobacter segnis]MDG2520576.1 DUF5343 domain-containing protein [Caulobacter segnis]
MAGLPYVTSPGNIDRALNGIKQAAVPERVSQDFVKTILKIPGGSGDQMTTFLKKIGFAGVDGTPSDIYKKFRNPAQSGAAAAAAIRSAYAPLYIRNEFMHELADDALVGLITEETGLAHDSAPVKMTFNSIKHLKAFANFKQGADPATVATPVQQDQNQGRRHHEEPKHQSHGIGLNLGYTINLNLPATADPEVFDAIFKSLKTHLLRPDDA